MTEETSNGAVAGTETKPEVQTDQPIETAQYVPQYKIKPEFKQALLKAIGNHPFNQIAGIINAINVPQIDHQTLTQVINVLGQFPYLEIEPVINNINGFITQIIED